MKIISLSIFSGTVISLGLFWLMQVMISNNQMGFKKTEPLHMTEFVRLDRDSELKVKDRQIEDELPPPEKRPPPPQMEMEQTQVSQNNAPKMDMPNLDIPLQTSRFASSSLSGLTMGVGMGTGKISTNLIPLAKFPPRCSLSPAVMRKGAVVKVELTITTLGTVKDAKVVEAKPKKIFNRCILKAIKRWKFKPKFVDGVAVEQVAIQEITIKK